MTSPLTRLITLMLLAMLGIWLPACAPIPTHPYWDMPPFGADDIALYRAFESSCTAFKRRNPADAVGGKATMGTYGQWQAICAEALTQTPDNITSVLARRTTQKKMGGPGKFTGYFKPLLDASPTQGGEYQYPLLAKPDDLIQCPNGTTGRALPDGTCAPYPARGEIEATLARYTPLAWLKDPVDVFTLQVQGSGTLEFPGGKLQHVGFAGKNGHPYVSIGKVLKDMGELTMPITAEKIRAWFKQNPHRRAEIMAQNPSFIFFHLTDDESPGALGVRLTPGRSLAVDRSYIPLGVPVRVVTTLTAGEDEDFDRLMMAHDVGSAIKGASRGDIYFGHGPMAGKAAGSQNADGSLYVLVPRS